MVMFLKVEAWLVLWFLVLSVAAAAEDVPEAVATLYSATGSVSLVSQGVAHPAEAGTLLYEGDRLLTGSGARAAIRFTDGGRMFLAEGSELDVFLYRYPASVNTPAKAELRLVNGAFRAITGLIGRQAAPDFKVHTSVATIGIRGTDFWGGYRPDGAVEVAMFSGKGVYVFNSYGTSEITQPGYGVRVMPGSAPDDARPWSEKKLLQAEVSTQTEP